MGNLVKQAMKYAIEDLEAFEEKLMREKGITIEEWIKQTQLDIERRNSRNDDKEE